MGARWGCSTFAFLAAAPPTFVSYDIKKHNAILLAEDLAEKEGLNFIFHEDNVLEVEIDPTDLLFIDTWHKYGQLKEELRMHAHKVKKYIILHDTKTYGETDEPDWGGLYKDVKELSKEKQGLNAAIREFILENPQWSLEKVYNNNNGLTILKNDRN
jgi:hypothetical protein